MNLFTYGSLIFPQVWEAVTGRPRTSTPANIRGFIRRTVRGASFPGIVATATPAGHDRVDGAIYHDVDPQSLAALDRFESDFYLRAPVAAETATGQIIACEAYIIPPERSHLLSESEWDSKAFETDALEDFLRRNFG